MSDLDVMSQVPTKFNCEECQDKIEVEGGYCQACCEHGDTDEYCCLDCGKELSEDRMAAAYDLCKPSNRD